MSRQIPAGLRAISSIALGSVAGQGLVILCYPLLTRLYTPAEFGLLTVFTSIVGMISVVSTTSLDMAIPIPPDDREAAAVAWAAFGSVTLVSVATAVAGLFLSAPLAALLGVPALAQFWWLVVLTVFTIGAYLLLSEWMIRGRNYGALGRRNLFQGIGQSGVQVGLGLLGVRPLGLLLGLGAGRLVAMGGLLSRGGLLRQPRPSLASVRAAVQRFRRFPLLATPSALVNTAGLEVPLLLVSAIYGDARAGLVGLTVRVISGPAAIIGQAVNQFFTGESSSALRDSQGTFGSSVRRAVRRLLAVGIGPAVVLVALGPQLFGPIFGSEWTEAGEFAQLLAFGYLAQFVVTPVSSTLSLLERQGQMLGWGSLRLVLTAGGPALCGVLGAPVIAAIGALAAGQLVSYVLLYLLCVRAADESDRRYRERPGAA